MSAFRASATWEGRDVVNLAVGNNNRIVRGLALLGRTGRIPEGHGPWTRLANADGRAKRDRDCQTMGSSPNRRVGSTASSFGVAQSV